MEPKIIKTDQQHKAFLAEVERLAADDPQAGTPAADRLELLAKLVSDYEDERFKFARPDPVEAIRFRMEERGLKQKDLATILGGKNRVSEVLAGKRPLTLSMVRALHETLGIHPELLIQEEANRRQDEDESYEGQISIPNLVSSGLFPEHEATQLTTGAIIAKYLKPKHGPLYLKRTITYGATPETNKTNLKIWVGRVRELANASRKERGSWRPGIIDDLFLSYVAHLSWRENGPRLAQEFLAEKGIALVILPALPRTKLDGAAMLDKDGAPIIGMTIRHDRLDNFWFTLLHELVHAWKHLHENDIAITDESIEEAREDDVKEAEANRLARETFISRSVWKRCDAFLSPSFESIHRLADQLKISPSIIAGRLRREKSGYGAFGKLVGYNHVRKQFPEVHWG